MKRKKIKIENNKVLMIFEMNTKGRIVTDRSVKELSHQERTDWNNFRAMFKNISIEKLGYLLLKIETGKMIKYLRENITQKKSLISIYYPSHAKTPLTATSEEELLSKIFDKHVLLGGFSNYGKFDVSILDKWDSDFPRIAISISNIPYGSFWDSVVVEHLGSGVLELKNRENSNKPLGSLGISN